MFPAAKKYSGQRGGFTALGWAVRLDVFINLRGAHRQGDAWEVHCCTHPDVIHGCHSSVLASGSSSVYINGKQAGRIDDPIACGGKVATGSDNVFIGG